MAEGPCDASGVCPAIATSLRTGYLEVWIGDLDYLSSAADRAAMRGFDLASNAEWVSSPLQLDYATRAIVLDAANAHWEPMGMAVFHGSAEFRLPFAMLSRIYLVDDPASLTPAAFTVTAGSGAAPTVAVAVGADDVKVTMTGIEFSKRRLRIKGDVAPGRPRDLRASRPTATAGVIRFAKALPRGAKVRGYQAVCRAGGPRRPRQRRRVAGAPARPAGRPLRLHAQGEEQGRPGPGRSHLDSALARLRGKPAAAPVAPRARIELRVGAPGLREPQERDRGGDAGAAVGDDLLGARSRSAGSGSRDTER